MRITGIWEGPLWGRFVTLGGSFYGADGDRRNVKPLIDCSPSDPKKPSFGITFERWILERQAGNIVRVR